MAHANSKTNGNRYSGVDATAWVVKDTSGKPVKGKDGKIGAYKGHADADLAARAHTLATGEYAQAVRA